MRRKRSGAIFASATRITSSNDMRTARWRAVSLSSLPPALARLYLQRLKPIAEADVRANAGGKLLSETARHLAVRMSFEDVIRVAEAKIAPDRFRRIEGEIGAKDQPYVITEFLKPGIEELCQVLPSR